MIVKHPVHSCHRMFFYLYPKDNGKNKLAKMNNNPLVSVLMTVYNREKYIAEAIESVINSTYQNWELIIVDDQSKDNSVDMAKNMKLKINA